MSGPLDGIKVIELGGIGPAPYACMLLADAGADVIRLERPSDRTDAGDAQSRLLNRSRPSVGINLRHPDAQALVLDLVESADALIEGFRPGATERLGLGPTECHVRNPKLVYGRMTGWGHEGPLAETPGHDINYIAVSGALWAIGRKEERPVPPLNLVGDFGGGGMLMAFGVCAALLEARESGRGQIVDAAMVDGAASMMAMIFASQQGGHWIPERGSNVLDSGAHFYEVYETADHEYFAVGAIEAPFYADLLKGLGFQGAELPDQMDRKQWPRMKDLFAKTFAMKTQSEWTAIFEGTDACASPVLRTFDAPRHRYNAQRETYVQRDGMVQPGPVPRFSRTPGSIRHRSSTTGTDTEEALAAWGIDAERLVGLRECGACV